MTLENNVSAYTMMENKKELTIYDISRLSGVSIATVSRVLNDSPKVSRDTKAKVMKVMDEHNYKPNVFAQGLGTGSIKTIGILCADVSDIYLANAVSFLERELRQEGFDTILKCTGYDYEEKVKNLQGMLTRKVDAVVLVGSQYIEKSPKKNEYIKECAKHIPVMLLNGELSGDNIYSILSNDEKAFYESTLYLINKGCKNILFLQREDSNSQQRKLVGYLRALQDSNIKFKEEYQFRTTERIQRIKDDLEEFFNSGKKVDGIIACDDELAIGALKFLEVKGISLSKEVSLIGCNNSVLSISCEPELTSIDNMCEVLCVDLVSTLMRVLNNEKAPSNTIIECRLVKRETA